MTILLQIEILQAVFTDRVIEVTPRGEGKWVTAKFYADEPRLDFHNLDYRFKKEGARDNSGVLVVNESGNMNNKGGRA